LAFLLLLVDVPLSGHDDGLTLAFFLHEGVRVLRDRKEMRLEIATFSAAVCLDDLWTVEGNTLEGVDRDENYAAVCVYAVLSITIADGVEDWKRRYQRSQMDDLEI
jgi:hypothetical protein